VLEDPPPVTRPRWFCHWDGATAPGFENVEEAIAWGLSLATSVVVRTLGGALYFAGARPPDLDDNDSELREWPPAASELRRIDTEYESAIQAANGEAAARGAYERERDEWLGLHRPSLAGRGPAHKCLIVLPGEEDAQVEFEELDDVGALAGGRVTGGGRSTFGGPQEVIAVVSGRAADDPWVRAVCAALERERTWTDSPRRSMLLVKLGEGTMFHATAVANRESILRHGLDHRRMGSARGIAGSVEPELPGIFLCATREGTRFFTDMARTPSDIWQVGVDGLWLEGDPNAGGGGDESWMILPEPIGPDRPKLVEIDIIPRNWRA
jgi:hypothetical protein